VRSTPPPPNPPRRCAAAGVQAVNRTNRYNLVVLGAALPGGPLETFATLTHFDHTSVGEEFQLFPSTSTGGSRL